MKNEDYLDAPFVEDLDEAGTVDQSMLMGGIIYVEVFYYKDKSIGDKVICHFGTHTLEKAITINQQNLSFPFGPDKIKAGSYDVYYTVTDVAGNQNTSKSVSVSVIEGAKPGPGISRYPAPVIDQAVGGIIDLETLTSDLVIRCSVDGYAQAGDTLRLHFGNLIIDKTLTFPVSMTSFVLVAKDKLSRGNYIVYFEVLRNEQQIGNSSETLVRCITDVILTAPIFPQAVDGVINLDNIVYVTAEIPNYDCYQIGDEITLYIGQFQQTIDVADPTATSFTIKFEKDLFSPGNYTAHYVLLLNGDYRISSPECVIAFNHKSTDFVSVGSVVFMEKASKGIPFKLLIGSIDFDYYRCINQAPNYKEHYSYRNYDVYLGDNIEEATIWTAEKLNADTMNIYHVPGFYLTSGDAPAESWVSPPGLFASNYNQYRVYSAIQPFRNNHNAGGFHMNSFNQEFIYQACAAINTYSEYVSIMKYDITIQEPVGNGMYNMKAIFIE